MTDASVSARHVFMAFGTSIVLLFPSAHAVTPRTLVAKVDRVSDGDSDPTHTPKAGGGVEMRSEA